MSPVDAKTKRKIREMGARPLLKAIEAQNDDRVLRISFDERLRLVVDHAHENFNHTKIDGLIRGGRTSLPNC